jgi:hypothetical protein
VLGHQRRHVQRASQERPQVARRHQLLGEAQAHVLAPPLCDQPQVGVVEVKHPVQIRPRRRPGIPAEHGRLFIAQELHRHDRNIDPAGR